MLTCLAVNVFHEYKLQISTVKEIERGMYCGLQMQSKRHRDRLARAHVWAGIFSADRSIGPIYANPSYPNTLLPMDFNIPDELPQECSATEDIPSDRLHPHDSSMTENIFLENIMKTS